MGSTEARFVCLRIRMSNKWNDFIAIACNFVEWQSVLTLHSIWFAFNLIDAGRLNSAWAYAIERSFVRRRLAMHWSADNVEATGASQPWPLAKRFQRLLYKPDTRSNRSGGNAWRKRIFIYRSVILPRRRPYSLLCRCVYLLDWIERLQQRYRRQNKNFSSARRQHPPKMRSLVKLSSRLSHTWLDERTGLGTNLSNIRINICTCGQNNSFIWRARRNIRRQGNGCLCLHPAHEASTVAVAATWGRENGWIPCANPKSKFRESRQTNECQAIRDSCHLAVISAPL